MPVVISKYANTLSESVILQAEQKVQDLQDKQDTLERSLKFFYSFEHDLSTSEVMIHLSSIKMEMSKVERCLSECRVLNPMRHVQDQEQLIDDVIILNNWLLTQFQVTKAMDKDMQEVLALTIIDQFKSISIDELLLVYKNAIAGKYGEVFNRIDTAVICGWIRKYIASKQAIKHARQDSMHANTSSPTRSIVQDAEATRQNEKTIQFKEKYFSEQKAKAEKKQKSKN